MKKLLSFMLILGLLLSVIPASAQTVKTESDPGEGVVFSDDFEEYTVGEGANPQTKPNWNYGIGGTIAQVEETKCLDNPYGYYQLPYSKLTTDVVKISYDVFLGDDLVEGNGMYSAVYTGDDAGSWLPAFYVFSIQKTAHGGLIYWGDAQNYGARPVPSADYTPQSSTFDANEWHTVGVEIDYNNATIKYYLDGEKAAEHLNNNSANAPVAKAQFKYFGICRIANPATGAYIDNFKVERAKSTKPQEGTGESFSITEEVPEKGLILKDDFNKYATQMDLKHTNGGNFERIGSGLIIDGSNKFPYVSANSASVAYSIAGKIGKESDITSGKIKYEYKVCVPKSKTEVTVPNKLYAVTYSKKGWDETQDRNYFNTVVYDDKQPTILFGGEANRYACISDVDASTVVKNIEHDKWYTIQIFVDFDKRSVTQKLGDETVSEYRFVEGASKYFAFDILQLAKINNSQDAALCPIYIDDMVIERLEPSGEGDADADADSDSFTVVDELPETGVIAKDGFTKYDSYEWASSQCRSFSSATIPGDPKNVWHYTQGDIISEASGNKCLDFKWTSSTAYYLDDHVKNAYVDTGKLKYEYKFKIKKMNVSDTKVANSANGDRHTLYVVTWGPNGHYYPNTIVYDPIQPFIVFSKNINIWSAANEVSVDDTVVKNVEFDKWYTVTTLVDFGKGFDTALETGDGKLTQYLNGSEVTSLAFYTKNAFLNLTFNEIDFQRTHSKDGVQIASASDVYYVDDNGKNAAVEILVDDFLIERVGEQAGDKLTTPVIMNRGSELDPSEIEWLMGEEEYDVVFTAPTKYVGESANVVIAAYCEGKFLGLASAPIASLVNGENEATVTLNEKFIGADTLKAFVFSRYEKMCPYAEAAVYTIN